MTTDYTQATGEKHQHTCSKCSLIYSQLFICTMTHIYVGTFGVFLNRDTSL